MNRFAVAGVENDGLRLLCIGIHGVALQEIPGIEDSVELQKVCGEAPCLGDFALASLLSNSLPGYEASSQTSTPPTSGEISHFGGCTVGKPYLTGLGKKVFRTAAIGRRNFMRPSLDDEHHIFGWNGRSDHSPRGSLY
jgi:hypothetical protein